MEKNLKNKTISSNSFDETNKNYNNLEKNGSKYNIFSQNKSKSHCESSPKFLIDPKYNLLTKENIKNEIIDESENSKKIFSSSDPCYSPTSILKHISPLSVYTQSDSCSQFSRTRANRRVIRSGKLKNTNHQTVKTSESELNIVNRNKDLLDKKPEFISIQNKKNGDNQVLSSTFSPSSFFSSKPFLTNNSKRDFDPTNDPIIKNKNLVMKGPARLLHGSRFKERFLFLYHDFLILTKFKNSKFKLKEQVPLVESWVNKKDVASHLPPELIHDLQCCFIVGCPEFNHKFPNIGPDYDIVSNGVFEGQNENNTQSNNVSNINAVFKFDEERVKNAWFDHISLLIEKNRKDNKATIQAKVTLQEQDFSVTKTIILTNNEPSCQLKERCFQEFRTKPQDKQFFSFHLANQNNRVLSTLTGIELAYHLYATLIKTSKKQNSSASSSSSSSHEIKFLLRRKGITNKTKSSITKPFVKKNNSFENEEGKKNQLKKKVEDAKVGGFIGRELGDLIDSQGRFHPLIIKLLTSLYIQSPVSVGVFRKTGSPCLKQIKAKLDQSLDPLLLVDLNTCDLAALFKDFLRNLPGSLLMNGLYGDWMKAASSHRDSQAIDIMRSLLQQVPPPNLLLLFFLFFLLRHVTMYHYINLMTVHNLSICISQCLICPVANTPLASFSSGESFHDPLADISKLTRLTCLFINHLDDLLTLKNDFSIEDACIDDIEIVKETKLFDAVSVDKLYNPFNKFNFQMEKLIEDEFSRIALVSTSNVSSINSTFDSSSHLCSKSLLLSSLSLPTISFSSFASPMQKIYSSSPLISSPKDFSPQVDSLKYNLISEPINLNSKFNDSNEKKHFSSMTKKNIFDNMKVISMKYNTNDKLEKDENTNKIEKIEKENNSIERKVKEDNNKKKENITNKTSRERETETQNSKKRENWKSYMTSKENEINFDVNNFQVNTFENKDFDVLENNNKNNKTHQLLMQKDFSEFLLNNNIERLNMRNIEKNNKNNSRFEDEINKKKKTLIETQDDTTSNKATLKPNTQVKREESDPKKKDSFIIVQSNF